MTTGVWRMRPPRSAATLATAMSSAVTHQTAPTRFVDAGGVRFAFRRFGVVGRPPLVMLQHFRGNLDNWDPALTDALAAEREVVLVDYPGVGASGGEPCRTIADTARRVIAFTAALDLSVIDLLGFSIGGFAAQEIVLIRPGLVRRLILAGTGPKGAPGMHGWRADIAEAARLDESTAESLLHIFFAPTETSRAKGREFLARFMQRSEGRDPPTSLAARDAQYDAIVEWGIPDHGALQRLTAIRNSTLIIQGDGDLMIPTKLSYLMAGLIPDAQIRIYPDSAHASLFQYPDQVARDVNEFLSPDA
jgi:pimeloyl-ACP methyl ester carboxylesterase